MSSLKKIYSNYAKFIWKTYKSAILCAQNLNIIDDIRTLIILKLWNSCFINCPELLIKHEFVIINYYRYDFSNSVSIFTDNQINIVIHKYDLESNNLLEQENIAFKLDNGVIDNMFSEYMDHERDEYGFQYYYPEYLFDFH